MKHQITTTFASILIFASMSLAGTSAIAGPDFFQQQLNQKLMASQQQLEAARKAKETERDRLMTEHMQSMHEVMQQMHAMKPKAGMTMEEHQAWIDEHLKLMDTVMDQMMGEYHLLLNDSKPHQH